jgi:menaquinone-9 beta-reductase
VRRSVFDAALRDAALAAGADGVRGHAVDPILSDHRGPGRPTLRGFVLDDDRRLSADVVIGADGATSRVAEVAGLVDMKRVLWGFAVRSYLDATVEFPVVALWDEKPWHAFSGYGWIFPGPGETANAGLGIGIGRGRERRRSAVAVRLLPAFLDHLTAVGLLDAGRHDATTSPARLGGWLKMGMVGTVPAAANVLLVGDAAGLVNPLQGEGIAQAMTSGRAAAEAVLAGPSSSAASYRVWLADTHLPYETIAAVAHDVLVGRPRVTSAVARLLTLPLGPALAGGWALFWNELFDGAPPGRSRAVAGAVTRLGALGTSAGATARWFRSNLYEATPTGAGRQRGQGR